MAYTIYPYGTNNGYTTKSVNDNISSIMSRMIQIAGRLCENYASDVYYALCNYDNAVRENYEYDKLITFRESGVIECKIENGTVNSKFNGIQCWRLTWNPQKKEGVFTRVRLKELKEVNNG